MSYHKDQEEPNNDQPPSHHHNLILDSGTKRLIDLTSRPPEQRSSESIEELISILQRKAPKLLDGLTETNKVQVAKQSELKIYLRDEVVFHQGDEPDAYFTVIRGAVSIYALNSSLAKGSTDKSSSDDLIAGEYNGRDQYGIFIAQLPPGEVRRIAYYVVSVSFAAWAQYSLYRVLENCPLTEMANIADATLVSFPMALMAKLASQEDPQTPIHLYHTCSLSLWHPTFVYW